MTHAGIAEQLALQPYCKEGDASKSSGSILGYCNRFSLQAYPAAVYQQIP
jgi:hypothetical protein